MPGERVLIVAKTKMQHGLCVGAISTEGQSFRLLTIHGDNQDFDCAYQIGDVWKIDYALPASTVIEAPHVEDVLVRSASHEKSKIPMRETLMKIFQQNQLKFWQGKPDNLFDGLLNIAKSGSAYIEKATGIPKQSTWFWEVDKPLYHFLDEKQKPYYRYEDASLKMPYVGLEAPPDKLSSQSLLRVSLARWWRPKSSHEPERCYLQLSGWYL